MVQKFCHYDGGWNLQSSDFGGELSDKQLQYCAKDVIYLHKIYEGLKKILIREKRDRFRRREKGKGFGSERNRID